jgi:DHA1 family tetracycline resistance protein-like MFS transporter
MAQQILQSLWALYTQARFGWDALDVGMSLALAGIASAAVQGGLIRALLSWLGERRTLVVGLAISAMGFVAFGMASRGWMLYAIIVPFALGGVADPASRALLSREVGPSEQGELQGSLASLSSLTAIAGPLLGTSLFARFGPPLAEPSVPGAPFFAAACFNALGVLLVRRLFARVPPKAT